MSNGEVEMSNDELEMSNGEVEMSNDEVEMSNDEVEMPNNGSGIRVDATVDTFDELVKAGHVLVDIWGPDCQPCLRLMPAVHELAERYADRVRLIMVNAPENRKICR